MSAHSSISSSEVAVSGAIMPGFMKRLALGFALWAGLALGFVWVIDPYGVSPIRVRIKGINETKYSRIDIDRQIKALEVLRYQPRTIFMGTSRIHQSLDPAHLNETPFGRAYNASIPGSTISENAAHLEQYLKVNWNIRHVFVEAFFYDFTRDQNAAPQVGLQQLALNAAGLLASTAAVRDAAYTVYANRNGLQHDGIVSPRGHWVPPDSLDTEQTFQSAIYTNSVLFTHRFQPVLDAKRSAFAALDRIAALCAEAGATLHVLVTPSYPWDDHRLHALRQWGHYAAWLSQLSRYPNVYSLAQYNALVEEPAGPKMTYWYDPVHFSALFGELVLKRLASVSDPRIPENLLRLVTPESVGEVLAERAKGFAEWSRANPAFGRQFDQALLDLDDAGAYRLSGAATSDSLLFNGNSYEIVRRIGGSLEGMSEFDGTGWIELHGWVADHKNNRAASGIIVVLDGKPYFRAGPVSPRKDIEGGIGSGVNPAGFRFSFKLPERRAGETSEIRLFALTQDNKAVPVSSAQFQGPTTRIPSVEFPKD